MLGLTGSQIGYAVVRGLLTLLLNPLSYLGCLLMVLERSRAARQERRFFGARVSRVWGPIASLWLQGIAAGIVVSAVCIAAGVVITPLEVGVVSALTIILGVIRVRLFSAVYAMAILLLASLVLRLLHIASAPGAGVAGWLHQIAGLDVAGWLAIAAALFLAEAVLLRSNRRRQPGPAYVVGKRGRPVGAFLLQLSFFVPVVTLSPGSEPMPQFAILQHGAAVAGWPLLAGSGGALSGWTLCAIPLFAGMSSFAVNTESAERASSASRDALVAGLLLAADTYAVFRFGTVWAIPGVAILLITREWTVWRMHRREAVGEPIYATAPNGVRVLAASPGSIADEMGLKPREVVTHVNQVAVHTGYDLHFAIAQNPAYARLRVEDAEGEPRFVGKPVYTGGRNQLGLILAPDETARTLYAKTVFGLFESLRARTLTRDPAPDWVDPGPTRDVPQ